MSLHPQHHTRRLQSKHKSDKFLRSVRYKWPHFGFIAVWASTVWVAGFILREISVFQTQNISVFIAQYVCILVGPPLFAASESFILGRLLAYLPYHAPLHPGRVLSTFLLLGAAVESMTASGAANSAGTDRTEGQLTTGHALVNAALILQAFIELGFFVLVAVVLRRCHHNATAAGRAVPTNVRVVCYVLFLTSAMMLVRCIVRAVEGFEASNCSSDQIYCGTVQQHEVFLWVFEVANITLFVFILALFPPGKYLPNDTHVYLDPNEAGVERFGPGWTDKRPWWVTVFDPFNVVGALKNGLRTLLGRSHGNDSKDRFWERPEEWPIVDGNSLRLSRWTRKSSPATSA